MRACSSGGGLRSCRYVERAPAAASSELTRARPLRWRWSRSQPLVSWITSSWAGTGCCCTPLLAMWWVWAPGEQAALVVAACTRVCTCVPHPPCTQLPILNADSSNSPFGPLAPGLRVGNIYQRLTSPVDGVGKVGAGVEGHSACCGLAAAGPSWALVCCPGLAARVPPRNCTTVAAFPTALLRQVDNIIQLGAPLLLEGDDGVTLTVQARCAPVWPAVWRSGLAC